MATHVHPHPDGSYPDGRHPDGSHSDGSHRDDRTPAGDLTTALRERGMRVTHQREQVLANVRRLGHATPEEISASLDGVDVTTVYRTLQLLEEIGLVAHTHLGHGAPAYRPAEDQHIHVVCHDCGSVIDAPVGLVDALAHRLHDERGFTVDLAHFAIFGRCADCAGNDTAGHGTK